MENIPINIQQLIDNQNLQIKALIESNEKLNQKIEKMDKRIKDMDRIYKHNTDVFDTDLYKVEEHIKDIKENVEIIHHKFISKKGNKRRRNEDENEKTN